VSFSGSAPSVRASDISRSPTTSASVPRVCSATAPISAYVSGE
jgi:hypothetical protein